MADKINLNIHITAATNGFIVAQSWQENVPGPEYPEDPRPFHPEFRDEQFVFTQPAGVGAFVAQSLIGEA